MFKEVGAARLSNSFLGKRFTYASHFAGMGTFEQVLHLAIVERSIVHLQMFFFSGAEAYIACSIVCLNFVYIDFQGHNMPYDLDAQALESVMKHARRRGLKGFAEFVECVCLDFFFVQF